MLGYMAGSYPQHIVAIFVVYGNEAIGKVYTKQLQYGAVICLAYIGFKYSYHILCLHSNLSSPMQVIRQ